MSEWLSEANRALADGRYELAAKIAASGMASSQGCREATRIIAEAVGRQGRLDEAVSILERHLENDPEDFYCLNAIAAIHWKRGAVRQASECCSRLIANDPSSGEAWSNLGLCRLAQEENHAAVQCFQRAIELDPRSFVFHFNLAGALDKIGSLDNSAAEYEQALSLEPDRISAIYNLAELYFRLVITNTTKDLVSRVGLTDSSPENNVAATTFDDRLERAAELLTRYVQMESGSARAHTLLGAVLQQQGKHAESLEKFKAAIQIDPNLIEPYWRFTRSKHLTVSDLSLFSPLQEIVMKADRSGEELILAHNTLGKAFDDVGNVKAALAHFDESHKIAKLCQGICFNRAGLSEAIDAAITFFDRKFFANTRIGSHSQLPIFIVGMPRSGTTLTEQILSSHPYVRAGGEIPFWPDTAGAIFNPTSLSFDEAASKAFRDLYLEILSKMAYGAARLVDKNPANTLNVGLLHTLFPRARIVVCRRNPADNCLSMYMAHFQSPPAFVHDREDLVFAFQEHERMIDHWKSVIPGENLMEINYEDLVLNRAPSTAKLTQFCELKWDDACLHPERNDRVVTTASQWQVRQPVYSSSVGRWKKYEAWLGAFAQLT